MSIIGSLIQGVAAVIGLILNLYMLILILHAILSWVNPDPGNPVVRFVHNATEPLLYRIRKTIPTTFGGMDFSVIIALVAITFLNRFLVGILSGLAQGGASGGISVVGNVIGYFIIAIADLIEMVLGIVMLIIVFRAILSFVNPDPFNPIVRFIHNATEPLLSRIRGVMPTEFSGIDISPLIALLGMVFLSSLLGRLLYGLAGMAMG